MFVIRMGEWLNNDNLKYSRIYIIYYYIYIYIYQRIHLSIYHVPSNSVEGKGC